MILYRVLFLTVAMALILGTSSATLAQNTANATLELTFTLLMSPLPTRSPAIRRRPLLKRLRNSVT